MIQDSTHTQDEVVPVVTGHSLQLSSEISELQLYTLMDAVRQRLETYRALPQ